MQTKYLCVLIHIWIKGEVGAVKPVKYFTDCSKAVLLLWIFHVFVLSCVCYVFVFVCLYVLCGHLLGKGWPLGSRLWCLTVSLSLSHWYPGSGVVLDCIHSWSLHPYLLQMIFSKNSLIWSPIFPNIPLLELVWDKSYAENRDVFMSFFSK